MLEYRCIEVLMHYYYLEHIGGYIMAFKITDACVSCGTCAENCPAEAIEEG